jgi:hypothetical protein
VTQRVQIHYNLFRVLGQTAHPCLPLAGFNLGGIVRQLVTAAMPVAGKFQPVERRRPGQRHAPMNRVEPVPPQRIGFFTRRRQQRGPAAIAHDR